MDSVKSTKKILIVEDGSKNFGIGSEILANIQESSLNLDFALRVGAKPYPIPSVSSLEHKLLPVINVICTEFNNTFKQSFPQNKITFKVVS